MCEKGKDQFDPWYHSECFKPWYDVQYSVWRRLFIRRNIYNTGDCGNPERKSRQEIIQTGNGNRGISSEYYCSGIFSVVPDSGIRAEIHGLISADRIKVIGIDDKI